MADEVELIITGAPVYTVDAVRGWASAVAVGGGRIAAVGAERDVLALRGPRTRVLSLDGGMVVPSFQDAHALPLAGVTAATTDPPNGRLERDQRGAPTGVLHEGAMRLVERVVPPPSTDELARALATAQAYLHRLGISAWQDAWVLPAQLDAYRAAAAAAKLTARVVAALKWQPEAGEEQLDGLVEQRRTASVGRLRAGAVKIVQDGVFENFTAAMLDPYLGRDGGRGISMLPADELARVVTLL